MIEEKHLRLLLYTHNPWL